MHTIVASWNAVTGVSRRRVNVIVNARGSGDGGDLPVVPGNAMGNMKIVFLSARNFPAKSGGIKRADQLIKDNCDEIPAHKNCRDHIFCQLPLVSICPDGDWGRL